MELTLSSPSLSAAPALNLYKVTEEWDIDEICYNNQPDSDLRKSNVGAQRLLSRNGYSFDLSNWIEGYEDEVDTLEEYRDYGFMIECSEDGYAQLHSSENSHAKYMPVFVIEYSYYHDDSLEDGAVYSFKNSASNKYMTVYSGGTAEGTNVCQSYSATPTLSQTFRLDYDEDCECFRIRSLCSSNGYGSALTYSYSFMTNNPTDSTSRNVYLYSIDEEDSAWEDDQAWMIVQHNYTDLYKIVSKKNPDLAVTVCGTASGTSGGNTATSAGNIFVSEFTGAANQLWKIESGGIQLNNGENIKTVTAKDYVSEENNLGQFFCPVTEFGETVAWSSNNIRSVAVEPNGNVTTVKAGIANITATVTHANGTTTAHSCTIYVVIENGVYCFNNVESGYRIEYESSSDYSDGAILEVYDNGDEDEESDVPTYALFKIKYLGSGRYSIRSMLRSDMGWCSLDNFSELTMLNIGKDDSDIPSYAKWFISYSENGYYIYTYQTRTVTSSTESGDNVTTSNYNPNNPNPLYQWNLTKVTTECNGITIYRQPNTIVVGRSNTYEASVYSSNTNINGQNGISWSVSGITGSATINSETGVLTGQSPGTVIVTATYTHSASQQWSNSCTVTVVPISNGVYYFKNAKFTGHNMQIDNNAGSSDNGAIMELWDRDGGYDQRWIITHVGDEYYKIVSSISNKALTAPSSADGMLTQTDYTQATTQQWKITIVGDGTYKLSPKSNESFYMSAGDGIITADGRNIRMRAAQSDNKDEWYIEQLYSTVFYGIESEGHDHESALSTVKNEMLEDSDDNQYWHGITLRTGEVTASVCKNDLKTANIFAIRTHGMESDESGTVITLNQANNTTSVTYFASHWIPEMITTNNSQSITITDDFSNVTLALFICCESGAGGEGGDNLPTRIVEYGAKAAVGFTKSIDCGAANTWTASFYEFLLDGDTLEDAARKAWEPVKGRDGFDGSNYQEDIIICGDKTLVLP
ncbi:MAG: RICIN domain-containing protein [Eubacteriales bacterium]